MHELLLFGQIPASRHEQLLKILAGVTAMQPQRIIERHAVYKPAKGPIQQRVQVGGSQAIQQQKMQKEKLAQNSEMFYIQLVQDVDVESFGEGSNQGENDDQKPWTMQFQDVPIPGKRPVVLRQTSKVEIVDSDPHQFMVAAGNTYV